MHEVDKYLATLSREEMPPANPTANRGSKWQALMDSMSDGDSVEMTKREYKSFYQATIREGHDLRWRTTEYKTKRAPSGAKSYCNESIGRAYLYKRKVI
jgi:hypothetical protein